MACKVTKTEHSGPKKANGAYWGTKIDAKTESKRKRRINDVLESKYDTAQEEFEKHNSQR